MDKKISDSVKYIGVQDKELKKFDLIFDTWYGTTYNSYLVEGKEKIAIIDTVKDSFCDTYINNIKEFISPDQIDYIIVNHAEPDHSSSLERILALAPKAQVVCSRACSSVVVEILNRDVEPIIVGTGDSLDLGGISLEFTNAPFLHWPETMFTYLPEEKVLFPCDFFGSHYGRELIDYSISDEKMEDNQKFYFDSIMSPFKNFALDALNKIDHLEVVVVCPSHGPVLHGDFEERKKLYRKWSTVKKRGKRAVVGYYSCYGYTKMMAEAIAKGVESTGIIATLVDLDSVHKLEAIDLIHEADALAVGSSTINRDVLHPFYRVFSELSTYVVRDKPAVSFGSYGWSGEAVKFIEERLVQLGFKITGSYKTKMKPSSMALKDCFDLGVKLAEAIG